jgi:pantetheine-phosphate adenylyltransferase
MKIAIYPGTFDPITNGHLDIIRRASRLFGKIIVAVSNNPRKRSLFSLGERKKMIQEAVDDLHNIEVDIFRGLLVRYAKKKGATILIRGLRAISDFESEFQMALMNRKLMPEMETVYLMPSEEYTYINSTIVKEVARLGGQIDCFLPPVVAKALRGKVEEMEMSDETEGIE